MSSLRFAWIGSHIEGVKALAELLRSGEQVAGIIQLDAIARARRSGAIDYKPLASRFNVPVHEVANINAPESVKILKLMAPDVVFVIGWNQILKPELLSIPRIGMVGAHASMLPRNRGSAPVNWSIIKGELQTGNSLIWLSDAVDGGDIIAQTEIAISRYDTCATIYKRVADTNGVMILELVSDLRSGRIPRRANPSTGEPLLPRRRPADGLLDWRMNSSQVYDFVRALTRPYPGAFSWLDGTRWTVWVTALLPTVTVPAPFGQILGPIVSPEPRGCGQVVACGQGAVSIHELQSGGTVLRGQELSEQAWTGKRWSNE